MTQAQTGPTQTAESGAIAVSAEWDRLREEILQSQRTRSDLLKWKLGLVGVLGATGLGLAGSRATRHADLVLCAVPLVCLYVDLLAYHLTLRILVIGAYFQKHATGYEELASRVRELKRRLRKVNAFGMEDAALWGATAVLSISLVLYGLFLGLWATHHSPRIAIPFYASGGIGLLGSLCAYVAYWSRREGVKELARADAPGDTGRDS